MSLRKASRLKSEEGTPNLRRSTRVCRGSLIFSPKNEKQMPSKKTIGRCVNKKKSKQKKPLVVEQKQQERPAPFDYETTTGETRDMVPVEELPGSPQEEKPKCDILFLLEHALKPNSREEVLPEDHQYLVKAASVLKSQLVTRLASSADILKTEDMIKLANRCYTALRELGDDYRSFHSEVNKLIGLHQELRFAAKDKDNWNDWDLKARHIQQVQFLSDASEKLSSAQEKLCRTNTHVEFLKLKKEELTAELLALTEELSEEKEKVKSLTVERDRYKEVHFDAEVGLGKLDAEKKKAYVALEATNAHYNATKEEFKRMTNHLLQLVRRPPSNQAEPSTNSFSSAEMATLPSTVSPRPVSSFGVFHGNQASGPAIGVSPNGFAI